MMKKVLIIAAFILILVCAVLFMNRKAAENSGNVYSVEDSGDVNKESGELADESEESSGKSAGILGNVEIRDKSSLDFDENDAAQNRISERTDLYRI